MTNTREVILKLKEVREEKQLSYTDILSLLEEKGYFLAKSTLSKIFSEGSEDMSFKYDETIIPLANVLLDIDTIEEDDILDIKAMKTLLRYKNDRIKELSQQLDKEKIKSHEKLEKEREQYTKNIEFLKHQIELKDKRMDQLLEAVFEKDKYHKELLNKILPDAQGTKKEEFI